MSSDLSFCSIGQLLILLFLTSMCLSEWVFYTSFFNAIPSYSYPLSLNTGDNLNATLSWPSSSDLDLFLYQEGVDFLSSAGFIAREFSSSANPEIMIFTIPTTGNYILRVDLFSTIPTAFKLDILINGVFLDSYFDTVLSKASGRTVQQFSTNNPCSIRMNYTGPVYPLQLYSPGAIVTNVTASFASDSSNNNPKSLTADLNVAGLWNVVIFHNLTTAITQTNFTLILETETTSECINFCTGKANARGLTPGTTDICRCKTKFAWDSTSQQCLIQCSSLAQATTRKNGTLDQCNCQPSFVWFPAKLECAIPCDSIVQASFASGINNLCSCPATYIWNQALVRCERNCAGISDSAGLMAGQIEICVCATPFQWDEDRLQCRQIGFNFIFIAIVSSGLIGNGKVISVFGAMALIIIMVRRRASQQKSSGHQYPTSSETIGE